MVELDPIRLKLLNITNNFDHFKVDGISISDLALALRSAIDTLEEMHESGIDDNPQCLETLKYIDMIFKGPHNE